MRITRRSELRTPYKARREGGFCAWRLISQERNALQLPKTKSTVKQFNSKPALTRPRAVQAGLAVFCPVPSDTYSCPRTSTPCLYPCPYLPTPRTAVLRLEVLSTTVGACSGCICCCGGLIWVYRSRRRDYLSWRWKTLDGGGCGMWTLGWAWACTKVGRWCLLLWFGGTVVGKEMQGSKKGRQETGGGVGMHCLVDRHQRRQNLPRRDPRPQAYIDSYPLLRLGVTRTS